MTSCHIAAAFLAAEILVGCAGQGVSVPRSTGLAPAVRITNPVTTAIPLVGVSAQTLRAQSDAGMTVPTYSGHIQSPLDGKTYTYQIVGSDPTKSNKTTAISYVPILVVVTFPDGTVLDPTQPGCNDSVSVSDRFYEGPNFVKTPLTSNGVNVGKTQLDDAFQRAEFWTILKGPKYHTMLKAVGSPIVAKYKAINGTTTQGLVCTDSAHRVGSIPISDFDQIARSLASKYVTPNQVALVLTYNIFLSSSDFTYAGYHSAFSESGGTQVYAVATYSDPHALPSVPGVEDISIPTHEIGELINDPFVNNATPAWGHVGQVTGCQSNLEVGDALTGHDFTLDYNGFTYHPQELVFFSWFFRTPSTGTGGKYSFEGSFSKTQQLCTS
ncbi:MAG: hypothetical protein WB615_04385 [Candidatus Tumulicola sp.]